MELMRLRLARQELNFHTVAGIIIKGQELGYCLLTRKSYEASNLSSYTATAEVALLTATTPITVYGTRH